MIDTKNDVVMTLGFLLRLTMDPSQDSSAEDIKARNSLLWDCEMEVVETAASFGGVNVDEALTLAIRTRMDHVKELEVVDTPEHPHDVDKEFINAKLQAAAEWNDHHPEAEPTPTEWQMMAVELCSDQAVIEANVFLEVE